MSLTSTGTLGLYNNSYLPGDSGSTSDNGGWPSGAVYDPAGGVVWTSLDLTFGFSVREVFRLVNVTTQTLSTYVVPWAGYISPYVTSYVFDPVDDQLFLVDENHAQLFVLQASPPYGMIQTVKVGSSPVQAAYDPQNNRIYVVNSASGNVSVVAGVNDTVVATISVPGDPDNIAYDPVIGAMFVTGSANITEIDTSTDLVTSTLHNATDVAAGGVVYDPASDRILVSDSNNSIGVVDPATDKMTSNLTVLGDPGQLTFDPGQDSIIASLEGALGLEALNATSYDEIATISEPTPSGLVFVPSENQLFVTDFLSSSLTVLDARNLEVVSTLYLGASPVAVFEDPVTGDFLLPDDLLGGIWVIGASPARVIGFVPTGPWGNLLFYAQHEGGTYDPDTGWMVVALPGQANLTELGGTPLEIVGSIQTNISPNDVVYDPVDDDLVAVGASGLGFYNASTGALVAWTNLSDGQDITFNPETGDLFATSGQDFAFSSPGTVYLISSSSRMILQQTTVSAGPGWMALDPLTGDLWVACSQSGNLTVLSSSLGELQVIAVPSSIVSRPTGVAYDPTTDTIDVAEATDGNLYVYDATTYAELESLPVASYPGGMVYDASIDTLLVAGVGTGVVHLFQGLPGPVISSFTVSPYSLPADESAYFSTTVLGSSGALAYSYAGLPPGCVSTDTDYIECNPSSPGEYTVTVTVQDTTGGKAQASVSLTVTPAATAFVKIQISPANCGPVNLNGHPYYAGGTYRFAPAEYVAKFPACSGYSYGFLRTAGHLSLANGQVTIGGDGTLNLTYVPPGEVIVRFSVLPQGCGGFVGLAGSALGNRTDALLSTGSYPLSNQSCPGYAFDRWSASGNLTVSGGNLVVAGNGTLVATFVAVPPVPAPGVGLAGDILLVAVAAGVLVVGFIGVLVLRKRRARPPRF